MEERTEPARAERPAAREEVGPTGQEPIVGGRVDRWDAETTDAALIAGMRAGEERAYSEFVRRWQPLLSDAARRQGIPAGARDELAADVLVEAASAFGSGRAAPRAMAAYLVAALRNRARNAARDEARRNAREGAAGELAGDAADGEGVWGWRPPAPDAAFDPAVAELLHPALAGLAAALHAGTTADERLLLVWVGHRVPHRDVAAWLGIGRAAVAKRVERLRDRLRRSALAHLERVDPVSRAELLRFFRRADAAAPPPSAAGPSAGLPAAPSSSRPANARGRPRPRSGSPTAPQGSEE